MAYTDAQKHAALDLCRELKSWPAVLAKCEIGKTTLRKWCKAEGIDMSRAEDVARTEAACAVKQAENEARMEEVKERLTKRIIDLDKRLDEEYETYWGVTATPVTYKRPPADAVKALASSIGIFIDKYQCLTGKQVGIGEHFTFTLDLNAMTGRDESTG